MSNWRRDFEVDAATLALEDSHPELLPVLETDGIKVEVDWYRGLSSDATFEPACVSCEIRLLRAGKYAVMTYENADFVQFWFRLMLRGDHG